MTAREFLKDLRININRFVTIETDVDEKGTAIMLYDLLESYHEAKLKENMADEMNELLETIAIKFESRKLYGTKVGGCDWYANEVRKYKR